MNGLVLINRQNKKDALLFHLRLSSALKKLMRMVTLQIKRGFLISLEFVRPVIERLCLSIRLFIGLLLLILTIITELLLMNYII